MLEIQEYIKEDIIKRHVQGEMDMFKLCYMKLMAGLKDIGGNERRMVHECFLLHARNLMDFLWPSLSLKSDDVIATRFVNIQIENIPEIDRIKKRINKQLSHITFNRSSSEQEDLLPKTNYIYDTIKDGLRKYNAVADAKYQINI